MILYKDTIKMFQALKFFFFKYRSLIYLLVLIFAVFISLKIFSLKSAEKSYPPPAFPHSDKEESSYNPLAQTMPPIQTSCRKLTKHPVLKPADSRVEKLNRLMDTAINWIVFDLQGGAVDFYCFRGKKIIVLNFWATWCAPCIKELPSLSKLAENHKDSIFVIAVSVEDKNKVQNFLNRSFKELSPELKIAVVNRDEKLKYFPQDNIPATYIFNKQGLLKIKELGDRDWSNTKIVQQILDNEK